MKTSFSQKNRNARAGFTFVEVLFAILIMTILAIIAISALTFPRHLAVMTAHKQAAIHAANEELEKVVSIGFSDSRLVEGKTELDFGTQYTLHGRQLSGFRDIEDLSGGTLKRITVSVDYPGGDEPVVLQTLLTQ